MGNQQDPNQPRRTPQQQPQQQNQENQQQKQQRPGAQSPGMSQQHKPGQGDIQGERELDEEGNAIDRDAQHSRVGEGDPSAGSVGSGCHQDDAHRGSRGVRLPASGP